MSKVAFLGLGGMGSRMAARLVDDHEVTVWNRTANRTAPLVERGATAAQTPAHAARDADVVITMLADPAALVDVSEGDDGIAAALRGDATVIEMSTVGPQAITRLAGALPTGVGILDAPVLGSLPQAEEGSLNIFVGGPPELVRTWTPLLELMGKPLPVGPLGSGAAAKLVANSTLFGTTGVLGEALALARGLGLEDEAAYSVLALSPVASQLERRKDAIISGNYPRRFPLRLARKDVELVREAAREAGVEVKLANASADWLEAAEAAGLGEEDYASVLEFIRGRTAPS
jgi:3-hydroxyisobutyrate dehydrogenase/2-hydroxy-3-oxopropionate reductase